MTTKLAAALAETFSAAELEELRESLIQEWAIPGTEALFEETPAAGDVLLAALCDAEGRAAR